jgi:hypothetical protein
MVDGAGVRAPPGALDSLFATFMNGAPLARSAAT